MTREWTPGHVVMATIDDIPLRCVINLDGDLVSRERGHFPQSRATVIRRLLTIDLPSGAFAGWHVLVNALREAREKTGYDLIFDGLIAQIEEQTRSRLAEPLDPSVRVYADGQHWARVGDWWVSAALGEFPRPWDYLAERDDVKVLP